MNAYWRQIEDISKQIPKDTLVPLLKPSNLSGAAAVLTSWGIIFLSMALVHLWPNPITIVLALILIGGRHLGLVILMHEAAHRTLFKSRKLNDFVGQWFCAYPTWNDTVRYREHHFEHHRNTGLPSDPDLGLITPYPTSKESFRRKMLRDLFGVVAAKRIYYILLMDLGFITYTISTNARRIDQTERTASDITKMGIKNLRGVVITNSILFFALLLLGAPELYLLWIGAYFTTYNVFLRVRSIAEHACLPDQDNALRNSRTTLANIFERLTFAPHRVNYHLEHHLFMQVPFFNLPKLHQILGKKGLLENAAVEPGYSRILQLAQSGTK